MTDTILRQIEMLRLIPRTGSVTPKILQQRLAGYGYTITERSIQRDLIRLSSAFPLECDDERKPHGWRWSAHLQPCQLPGLSTAEALAFQMLAQFERGLLPVTMRDQLAPYFAAAKQHLGSNEGPDAARNWISKVRVVSPNQPLLGATVPQGVENAVHSALISNTCLTITYRADEQRTFVVHPLGLVQHGPASYLIVRFEGYDDIRILALHRVRSARVMEKTPCQQGQFDLDTYIASGGFGFGEVGQSARIKVRFFNDAGKHLEETKLANDQTCIEEQPGQMLVTASVQLTRRLVWWLLGFGADVEVIKPASLRTRIAENLKAAAARY